MSAQVFFTADTHFQHRLVSGVRGYSTPEQHDEALIETWNSVVNPGDQVWHLGDVSMRISDDLWPLLNRLNGTIHLITGNHDPCWPGHRSAHKHQRQWVLSRFESVQAFARRSHGGTRVMLSHFPYAGDHSSNERYTDYRLRDEGFALLHGHTHSTERVSRSPLGTKQIHVGWDAWNRPVPIDEISRML